MDKILSRFQASSGTLRRKLFVYMIILLAFVLLVLASILSLLGQFKTPKASLLETCEIQSAVFQKEIMTHRNHLAMMGIHFSEDLSASVDSYLYKNGLSFASLNNSEIRTRQLEDAVFDTVRQYLMQSECSGAFVLFNSTVNTSAEGAANSKSGIYLQVNGYEVDHQDILLYRGISSVSKSHGVMPHRKWRLEFNTTAFPDYEEALTTASEPLNSSYRFTDFLTLPGMSERAMLITLPVCGSDGTLYAICGFEVSESFFKQNFTQPTKLSHMLGLLSNSYDGKTLSDFFSCGTTDGYYYMPKAALSVESFGRGLSRFTDGTDSYIGVISSCEDAKTHGRFTTAVVIPEADYDKASFENQLRFGLILLLLLLLSVVGCIYFSHRFLSPVLQGLEQVKSGAVNGDSSRRTDIAEIDNLLDFLAEKDNETEEKIQGLEQEISRLAYARKDEVDPDDFNHFLSCLGALTAKENEIFHLYLEGKSTKEILELCDISENTLKYHNRNIYSKLGINSRRQLLMYTAMMKKMKE